MDFFNFLQSKKFIFLFISIIFNIILGIAFGVSLYQNLTYEPTCDNSDSLKENNLLAESSPTEEEKFFVEVKGAVKNPGVYEAKKDNIINDLIKLAGGFNKNAYTNNINLSRKVSNELVVYVYTTSEYKKVSTPVATQTECNCPTYDISSCVENKQSEIVASSSSTSSSNENTTNKENSQNSNIPKIININTASLNELMSLSGIGESKAKEIIAYRESNGSFKSIEEIKNVSGIGDAVFEKIKNNITV